jgi:hypothetical protein
LILRNDGTVESERDLRIPGEQVQVLGIDDGAVVLERGAGLAPVPGAGAVNPRRIVTLDLTTGVESIIGTLDTWVAAGDVDAQTLVVAESPPIGSSTGSCNMESFPLPAGTSRHLAVAGCGSVQGLNVSPDGRLAAVAYRSSHADVLRVSVIDLGTGTTTLQRDLGYAMPYGDPSIVCGDACPPEAPVDLAGLAWADSTTLRIALIRHPASGQPRDLSIPGSVQVVTLTVG